MRMFLYLLYCCLVLTIVSCLVLTIMHRRWIKKTKEKAKVVAAVWGMELIQFLTVLAIFHQDDLKKRMNRICKGYFAQWML